LKPSLEKHCASLVACHSILCIKLTMTGSMDALSASTRPLTAPAAVVVAAAAASEEVTAVAAVAATVAVAVVSLQSAVLDVFITNLD
jgi:hypothetical protein